MSIDVLPDDVLLGIFDSCAVEHFITREEIEAWRSLAHVCRQWRSVVFGSPRRLNVRLFCATKTRTPLRDGLAVWPALPLLVQGVVKKVEEFDNAIAVLERSDRVCHINFQYVSSSHLANVLAAMEKPFPELTYLVLGAKAAVTVIPDSFLGGSAPRLRFLWLDGVPFPGLPNLLLSATHLDNLHLFNIPHSGYISLESIVSALSTLTSLGTLRLKFRLHQSLPHRGNRRPPPLTRSVLPVLTKLEFEGVSEYLEDLVARIDTPQLSTLNITLFNQIVFDTPRFVQFISRTPNLKTHKAVHLSFMYSKAGVTLSSPNRSRYDKLDVEISCREPDWQGSSLEQVCTSCLPPLSALEDLYIFEHPFPPHWRDNIENTLWVGLLRPFSGVKNLHLCEKLAPRIVAALQELVGDKTTEVLPTLQNIFLEVLQPSGPIQEGVVKFVAARQVSGQPITVSLWERYAEDIRARNLGEYPDL